MKDKVFIDTNIFIYFLLDDEKYPEKREKAKEVIRNLVNKEIIISTQVINEIYCTLLRHKIDDALIQEKLKLIIARCNHTEISIETIKECWKIKEKYKYSYWDSLILASAIQSNALTVFSEDMHNNCLVPFSSGTDLI